MQDKEYLNKVHKKIEQLEKQETLKRKSYNKYMKMAAMFIIVFTIGTFAIFNQNNEKINLKQPSQEEVKKLPTLDSYENLETLVKSNMSYKSNNANNGDIFLEDSIKSEPTTNEANSNSQDKTTNETQREDYSTTNVQVEGVDEADIVKTDGKYIYYLIRNTNSLVIVDASNPAELKQVSKISFKSVGGGNSFYPTEMYIDGNSLALIGTQSKSSSSYKYGSYDYYGYNNTLTKAICYDITDKSNIKETKTVEIEGGYNSSRKIGDIVYLISNKRLDYYNILRENANKNEILPSYRDTSVSQEYRQIPYTDIAYFPEFQDTVYTIIAGFNINNNEKASITAYLGNADEIYASTNNLYVVSTKYDYSVIRDTISEISGLYYSEDYKTVIYKFKLENGKSEFVSQGEVPGKILNQFSMDENGEYFRIATTKGNTWDEDIPSTNNLYILDNELKTVGKLEGLAKGEKIYSTRFMQNRLYMVTFKEVDPLFVIDLIDATNPKVLGELKIPGYSSYLHPYDENHVIGIGKDTQVMKNDRVIEIGMKMAIFDVSDVNNPKEKASIKIGDRGTYSEVLSNHKALLFSKEKGIIAFPATITRSTGKYSDGSPKYGETIYRGAAVYSIDLQKGFKLKGVIEHGDVKDYKAQVERIIFIKDNLFTMSSKMLKVNNIETLEKIGSIILK